MPARAHTQHLRKHRVSDIHRGYLLTTVTRHRVPIFRDFQIARLAIDEMRHCDEISLSGTLAFVVMPDHLHWLVQLRQGTLANLMQRFKSRSAAAINRANHTPGTSLWQPGFHDHAIRDGEDIRHLARYVIANPIRAGLVETASQYPHWDAAWL